MIELVIVAIVLIVASTVLYKKMENLEERLSLMEQKVNKIAYQIEFPEPAVNAELRQLIRNEEVEKAECVAREALGMTSLEGRMYVSGLKNEMQME
ncbi:hypothetical protein QR721_10390 [Aciduricibacillus chroicocephali]|uniref:Cell division protein FtsL n=1 Tax=Aciduricibacillus chroicocephali TaxID=3054939 RepID=A0ABY9KTL5_9BACI|nr:hypothetical protein QR721_10390 [Bacillaceae bacterium 44XB]